MDRAAAVSQAAAQAAERSTFAWRWQGTALPVAYRELGREDAPPVLMLPAMSSVSTLDELAALAGRLEGRHCVVTDWPGFGETPSAPLDYQPALYRDFLDDLVARLQERPGGAGWAAIACGHGAGYALDLEARRPGSFERLVLIAPTWRGPLPTVMGGKRPLQARIRRLIHMPVVGPALYRLNVSRPVVRMMYRAHVFADPAFLSDDLLAARMRRVRRPGARFASAGFVTGALDPFDDRAAFLAAARKVQAPILVLYGPETPPRSRAEIEALAALPGVEARRLGHGALGLAEEHAAEIAPRIEEFLSATR